MGKLVGLVGTISGKIGTMVYTKGKGGITYGRAYQPQVNNPKTLAQTNQRVKMNLVGRMSQVTPAEVLVSLGSDKRECRSEFNRMLLGVATVENSGSTPIAKIAPEDVVFSKGLETIEATVTTAASVSATDVTIGLTLGDSALAGKYGERLIVAVIDPSDKAGYSSVRYKDVVLDNTQPQQVDIRYGAPIASGSLVCVYRVPFVLNDEGVAMRTQTLANDGTDIIAKVLLSSGLVKSWGNSTLEVTEVFTQA